MNHFSRLALLGVSLSLVACSSIETEKVNYKSASKGPSLDVPPDLTALSRETKYAVPGNVVLASNFQSTKPNSIPTTALSALGDVRIERAGSQRWLVVKRPAEKLWDPVKEFWQESGFTLSMNQAGLGIMETDWAENRAKLPQDFIRNSIGKVLDSLYSTGERDKFRTRFERNSAGETEIFISHKGLIEVYNSTQKDSTMWQSRAADTELETEFLRRLMVKLGASKEQSQAQMAPASNKNTSRLTELNGQQVVQIDDTFDRAWRRVGLSLDRTDFTVEDRDRSQGVYFVRYVEPSSDKGEPGILSKIFGTTKSDVVPLKYRIKIASQGETTTISVQNTNGTSDTSATAQRILKVIVDDLK